MSNKIVPAIYRAIIDDVIQNMRSDFDDYGVSEEVLSLLQDKWETKIIASGVAEFEPPAQPPPPPPQTYHAHMQAGQHPHPPPTHGYALPVHNYVKTEPVDRPYVSLAPHPQQMQQYMLPQMKGRPAGQSVLALPRGAPPTRPTTSSQPIPPAPAKTGTPAGGSGGRIPQLDGPSYSQRSNQATEPSSSSMLQTQASRPRLPQLDGPASTGSSSDPDSPNSAGSPAKSQQATGEEINSDLDDSDSDNGDGEDAVGSGHAEQDIVFCTYDKVARVKNKWKCTLKDGMIHVNGKDYLFAKCNGEFEW